MGSGEGESDPLPALYLQVYRRHVLLCVLGILGVLQPLFPVLHVHKEHGTY
jgi:hypothetical protein